MIKYRKAKLTDIPTIQNLNYQLFLHDHEFDNFLFKRWPYSNKGKEYFKKAITDDDHFCVVALKDNKIIGYLAGMIWEKWVSRPVKTSEIDNMLILDEYRGQGVGSELIKQFIAWCKEKKVKSATVMAYWNNKYALSFYQKNGFEFLSSRLQIKL